MNKEKIYFMILKNKYSWDFKNMGNVNREGWAGLENLCTVEKIFINVMCFFFKNITAILLCHVCVGAECPRGVNADLQPSAGQSPGL